MMQLYTGIIEDLHDPLKVGRYRVRVFGVHSPNRGELKTEDLPWATTMQSTSSPAMSGKGSNPFLLQGSFVFVIFLDADLQKPVIIGSSAGFPGDGELSSDSLTTEITKSYPPITAPSNVVQYSDGSTRPTADVSVIPSGAKIVEVPYIGSLTKSNIDKLTAEVAKRETGGKANPYAVENTIGFIGKYQFGKDFLHDQGYLVKGCTKLGTNKEVISNPSYWTGKNGCTSKEVFFTKIDVQEELMMNMLKLNYSILRRAGVASETMPQEKLAGLLCAAHLKGAGGAIAFAKGQDSADAYGTSCSSYYRYGYRAISGVDTVEMPNGQNFNSTASDRNIAGQYSDARKYDTRHTLGNANAVAGFNDPDGIYPLDSMLNESDINRLARASKVSQTIVASKEADREQSIPVANSGSTWSQSPIPYNAEYPHNHVFESESGHILEFDDTPSSSRINIHHSSGTFTEIDHEGNQTNRVKGTRTIIIDSDDLVYIKGSGHVTVEGDISLRVNKALNIEVLGDANLKVSGDLNQEVLGDYNLKVGGSIKTEVAAAYSVFSQGIGSISSSNTFSLMSPNLVIAPGVLPVSVLPFKTYTPSIKMPSPKSRQESVDMLLEDNPALAKIVYANSPPAIATGISNKDAAKIVKEVSGLCGFKQLSMDLQLTANYRLSDLCKDGSFPISQGQHGLSAEEIACNLKQLCVNVIEPLREKYSVQGFKINSCFRPAGNSISKSKGISQHELGMAVDIGFSQIRGKSDDKTQYYNLACEIKDSVPFDQLILEYRSTGSVWIHLSFKLGGNRRQILTMYNDTTYGQGLHLLG